MKEGQDIQKKLFDTIKSKISENLSLVHEVADLLELSYDSAYRRLRCDKPLSLEEAYKLCHHFNISLDGLNQQQGNYLTFYSFQVSPEQFIGGRWLDFVQSNLIKINKAAENELVYAAKDPPIFEYLQFPEVAAFKFYFWEKTLFRLHENEENKFSISNIKDEFVQKCKQITELSRSIPTTEIWNEDTFRILIRQIEYCWVSGSFYSLLELQMLLDKLECWLEHSRKQAEYGYRFIYGTDNKGIENSYKLYENEIVLNDNTITVKSDGSYSTFMTYNVLGILVSANPDFCKGVIEFQKVLMSRSNLISQSGAKERNRFFNKLKGVVDSFKISHNIS